jgi:hypothetical protein
MGTNTSVWLVTNITIWDPAMSGCSVNPSVWSVSMAGKETMLIGGITPFAMTITGLTGMDMLSQGMTIGRERTGKMTIDSGRKANRISQSSRLAASAAPHKPLNDVNDIKWKPRNF